MAGTPILDDGLPLIELKAASAYPLKAAPEKVAAQPTTGTPYPSGSGATNTPANEPAKPAAILGAPGKTSKKRFYATIDLDPVTAKLSFAQIVDEVVQQFTTKHNVGVRISGDIEANSPTGFDDATQRAVRENCNVLKITNANF